jgi:hypothetical protein
MSNCNADNQLLTQQQKTTTQINELLAQSSQALLCGPGSECEKTQKTNDLQQKYLDAQTKLQTAPYEEHTAEKNYYIYSKGDVAYNDLIFKRLLEKAQNKSNEVSIKFNKNITLASESNDTLGSLTTTHTHMVELYETYIEENANLKAKILSYGADLITNDRKTFYEVQNYDFLIIWFKVWRWIYFILLIVFTVGIFLSKSMYSLKVKIGLLSLFIIYPFVINYIVDYLLQFVAKIHSLLPKNVYTTL